MPPHNSFSNALPPGRTGHACVQCRHRYVLVSLDSMPGRVPGAYRHCRRHRRSNNSVLQCMPLTRYRKQKCGGFTYDVKCQPCTNRNVKCSFEEEVKDLRFNPYLRRRSSRSPSVHVEEVPIDNARASAAGPSPCLVPALAAFDSRDVRPDAPDASPAEETLPKKIDSLQSRFVVLYWMHIALG